MTMTSAYKKWYDAMMADPDAKERYLARKRERSRASYRKKNLKTAITTSINRNKQYDL